MRIETERLLIADFTPDMAKAVHLNSLDEDTRRFVPDEVFETIEEARETIEFLIGQYVSDEGPFVHPILLKNGENIGYVQLVKIDKGWEIGYHVAKQYTGNGYATESVRAFMPVVAAVKHLSEVYGICLVDNVASIRVLEKCDFKEVGGACIDKYQYQGMDRPIRVFVWKDRYIIRTIRTTEIPLLEDFLYEAIFIPEGVAPPPRSIIKNEDLQVYVKDFGQSPDDKCLVAEVDGKIVGAIWSRIMEDYGHIADNIPSLAISLYKGYRNQGIGTALLQQMIQLLRREGYERVSLSVQKENYAAKMYLKAGFDVLRETEEEYIMILDLGRDII